MNVCELAVRMSPCPGSSLTALLQWLVVKWSDDNRAIVNDLVQSLFSADVCPEVFVCSSGEIAVVGVCCHRQDVAKLIGGNAIVRAVKMKNIRLEKEVAA